MSSWYYRGSEVVTDDIPKGSIGFIYIITQKSTGKRYIGRKLLSQAASRQVKGKRKKFRKESDWKDYWSSSPKIKEWIAESGTDDFSREILIFVSSKGNLVYTEELALYLFGALESDDWINDNIRSKVYRNWVKIDEAKELRNIINKLIIGS